jgi:hypothetical protein
LRFGGLVFFGYDIKCQLLTMLTTVNWGLLLIDNRFVALVIAKKSDEYDGFLSPWTFRSGSFFDQPDSVVRTMQLAPLGACIMRDFEKVPLPISRRRRQCTTMRNESIISLRA